MYEVITSIDADQKRSQVARASAPAADHDFLPAAAFRLQPGIGAPRLIVSSCAFRNDAFKIETTGGLQHRVSGLVQMLDVLDELRSSATLIEQLLQTSLAISQWKPPQILVACIQQVEREIGQIFGSSFREGRLQGREIRCTIVV